MVSKLPIATSTDARTACARWPGRACRSAGAAPRQPRGNTPSRAIAKYRRGAIMSSAPRLPSTDTTTTRRRAVPPAPESAAPTCAAKVSPGPTALDRDEVEEGQRHRDVEERHAPPAERSARGSVRPGSRTSPASFATSHQPPNEKNAATRAPASAAASGGAPGRRSTNGRKCAKSPAPDCEAPATSAASEPDLQRRPPPP